MNPKEVVSKWIERFNAADARGLAALYAEGAVNHQVANEPIVGRAAIQTMFAEGFATTKMVCLPENIFEDSEWAILEWRDPQGLRGCGFFHVQGGQIVFQRGYWDRISLHRLHGLPLHVQIG